MIPLDHVRDFIALLAHAWDLSGRGPVRVTSWYRDPQHNARVGGAPRSQHLIALALDVAPDQAGAAFAAAARRVGLTVIDEGDHFHIQRYAAGQVPEWLFA